MPSEQEFFRKIKTSGILDAAKNLGIDKNEFTNSKTAESYADHEWMVIDNSEVGIVLMQFLILQKQIPFPGKSGS